MAEHLKNMDKQLTADIIQWDINTWSKALEYWDKNIEWDKVQNCLEIGGREGGLSLWMALKNKAVTCSDLINTKESAQKLHQKYGVTSIKYQDINVTNIPYESSFDIIVLKSVLGGIVRDGKEENIAVAINQIYKALKPGGKLLFAENLIASPIHRFLRRRFNRWAEYWHYFSLKEINSLLSAFSIVHCETTGFLGTFGRNENQRKLLSGLDEAVFNYICSKNWKYVVYGIAQK